MSKYVYLPETNSTLPLLDKKLIYADVSTISFKSKNKKEISNALPAHYENIINFYRAVRTEGTHPRFNISDYCYKIEPDLDITPLIDLSNIQRIDFDNLTNARSLELKQQLEHFKRVYVFWSGGIDSTLILSAILKNWNVEDLRYLTVVCNEDSINEHSNFYNNFIKDKLEVVSSDLFFKNELTFQIDCVYVTGDSGDTMIGYTELENFNKMYPNIYNKSYKKHSKELVEYFGNGPLGYYSYKRIVQSLQQQNLDFDTVFDFLWWIEFNWAYSLEVYYMLWSYCLLPDYIDTKTFMKNNVFNWFGDIRYQHWAMSAVGTDQRIQNTIQSFKYSYKKYIYEFDQDLDYFLTKPRVSSVIKSRNLHHGKKVVAIDKDWTLYYL